MRMTGCFIIATFACLISGQARAEMTWVDWQAHLSATQTVTGKIGTTDVSITGVFAPPPQLGLAGESNWWACCLAAYSAPGMPGPATSDMIRLIGGPGTGTYTLAFSPPVTNPVMAIASLGGASPIRTTCAFDTPFTILTTGLRGAWGLGTPLGQTGNTLDGHESNGLIQFHGTVSTMTWTVPTAENWFGFTVGLATTSMPPPSPVNLLAGLEWAYTPEEQAQAEGFRLYRGTGDACMDAASLPARLADIAVVERTYTDRTVPVASGELCYELSAYNSVGESTRSNRAVIQAEALAPAAPTGLTVTS